jgi:RNA polymerase sigma-70 factor (ECF subfamily)
VRGATIDAELSSGDLDDSEPVADADAELFAQLYPTLRRFAAATGTTDVDPDDLVQEAVARTLRLHRLVELDDPLAYLRRAVLNQARNRRRGVARARAAITRLRPEAERRDEYASDLADLDRLSAVARAVLFLVEVEGWTFAAAGEQLGLSEEAARAHASRARRRLRRDLEEEL